MSNLENRMKQLTAPINGQYPRPWMTAMKEPGLARVFIVGKNQAKTFTEQEVGSHERFLDALFNRHGQSCRRLYDAVTGNIPSPTRRNIDRFVSYLHAVGVDAILETNVICYSTAMSADLAAAAHRGGRARGSEIFQVLLEEIKPAVIIAHGADTRNELSRAIGIPLPACPVHKDQWTGTIVNLNDSATWIYSVPSLAPPAFNQWSCWADTYLRQLAAKVAALLQGKQPEAVSVNQTAGTVKAEALPAVIPQPDLTSTMTPPAAIQAKAATLTWSGDWGAYFRKWFPLYGSGEQTSRVSFCLPSNGKRFFKLEPAAGGKRLSLMTHNYLVSQSELEKTLAATGFPCRGQEKYLEVMVDSIEKARECLALFMERIPTGERVKMD